MKRQGFTLIELLVVIAIIGLLSTLAVVALGSARAKARDSKRLSDLKQIQTALELYFTDQNGYPSTGGTLGAGNFVCLNSSGWNGTVGCSGAYMAQVPANPTPNGAAYVYAASSTAGYTVTASLETTVNGMGGAILLSPAGIQDVAGS